MDNTKLKNKLGTKVQALQESTEEITASSTYLALNPNTLDIIRSNLKSQPLTYELFDVVKSPSGGSTVFSVPGLSGDEAE